MSTLLNDIKYGFRKLRKSPVFASIAILSLALGIGVNTAIFSVANSVLLRPLPYKDADQLVMLWSQRLHEGHRLQASPLDFLSWQRKCDAFSSLGAIRLQSLILTERGEPIELRSGQVSQDFFETLGLAPHLGTTFETETYQPGAGRMALISHRLWRNRFDADPDIVGRSIRLGDEPFTVAGVMPNIRQYPIDDIAVWTPLQLNESQPDDRHFLFVVGRLKSGQGITKAQASLTVIAAQLAETFPQSHAGHGVQIIPLRDSFIGPIRPVLVMLFGAVGLVLLIACSNVASLLLARASRRRRELGVRSALGASRWRLSRQMLIESLLLAFGGGVLGIVLAHVGTKLLLTSIPAALPLPAFIRDISMDWRVLGFTMVLSTATGILFGLLPALRASCVNPKLALKEGEHTTTGTLVPSRLRHALIVAELALTMILLIAAGLLMKNFIQLQHMDSGLRDDHVLVMTISLPEAKYGQAQQKRALYRDVLTGVRTLPDVRHAGLINNLPFRGWTGFNFTIEGRPMPQSGQVPQANERVVSSGYFQTMGIPLIRGRDFMDREGPDTTPVVMVNQALVQRHFIGEDPLGQRIRPGGPDSGAPWYTIVGVVGDVLHFGLDKRPQSEIYKLNTQDPWRSMTLVVHTRVDPLALAASVKDRIWSVDPDQPVSQVADMTQVMSDSLWQARVLTHVQGVFGMMALLMSAVGLYGVIAQSVTLRTHEFGIHMALGAQPVDILKVVLKQGLKLILIGAGLGLLGAIALTRSLTAILHNTHPTDPVVYTMVTLFLAGVALVATLIPAYRGAKIDPMEALRYE